MSTRRKKNCGRDYQLQGQSKSQRSLASQSWVIASAGNQPQAPNSTNAAASRATLPHYHKSGDERTNMSKSKELTAKVTAAQIEKAVGWGGLSPRLQDIGKEINARLAKADTAFEQAENHKIAINQLLEEAKALCDEGGFKLFRETFCPTLGKSRSYELLAIAAGRRTIEQTKTRSRERQTKHRAKTKAKLAEAKAAAEAERPLVTHKSERPLVTDKLEHKAVTAKDIALREFNEKMLRLIQMTRGHKPKRFAKTSVEVADLSQLGRFLAEVAAARVEVDASAEVMKADHAQLSDAEHPRGSGGDVMNCHQRRESFAQLTPEDQHTTAGSSPIRRHRRKTADHARAVYDEQQHVGTVVERNGE